MASLYFDASVDEADRSEGGVKPGDTVYITGAEGRHASAVARISEGEHVNVGDGAGLVVSGLVVGLERGGPVYVEVTSVRRDPPPTPALWLAQALAKGDRDELAVQAATELGISGVIPWAAERSVSRWDAAKAAKGRERWASIVREASKQAIRSRVPEVAPLGTTGQLAALPGLVLVLEPTASAALTEVPVEGVGRITLVVGPEGGVAPRELELLEAAGALLVRLGSEVLRTSTAGPAAVAVLQAKLGRW